MKDESLIKELYDHFDELNFGFRPNDNEYVRCSTKRNELYEKMLDTMPEDLRKMFEAFEEMDSKVEYMMEKEIYRQGVCFGVKLVSEAFVVNKNRAIVRDDD